MARRIDPTVYTAALAALERALNQALRLSQGTLRQLGELEGSVFALHCSNPAVDVYLHPSPDGIRLAGAHGGAVTTSVRGEAGDFTELATSSDPTATLINGNLELRGDSAPLIELQKILSQVDVDWEAPLVDTLGDVAGHQIAQILRRVFDIGRQAHASLSRQLSEFIHEEARLAPPKLELEDFYGDVRELEQRVERLASRLARLRRRLDQRGD